MGRDVRPVAIVAAILMVIAARLLAQAPVSQTAAPATGDAAVSGVVIDGATRQPVVNAEVRLTATGVSQSQLSDARGRFVFRGLPASDSFRLMATKPGYFEGVFGRVPFSDARGSSIALDAREWLRDVEIRIERPASISGRVVDNRGRAIAGAYVRVVTRTWVAGGLNLIGGPVTRTDDRGIYRVPGLAAGTYFVAVHGSGLVAPPQAGEPRLYPTTFLGGTRVPAASTPITIAFGEEHAVSDIALQPAAFGTIRGYVRVPDGMVLPDLSQLVVRLVVEGDDTLGIGGTAVSVAPSAEGRFEFADVPRGTYVIEVVPVMADRQWSSNGPVSGIFTSQTEPRIPSSSRLGGPSPARRGGPASIISLADTGIRTTYPGPPQDSAGRFWGRTTVDADGPEMNNVVVQLRAGVSISGRVVVEGPAKPLGNLMAFVAEPSGTQARVDPATSEFRFDGLQPGHLVIRQLAGDLSNSAVASIMWNGRDYADSGLDTGTSGDLSGVTVTLRRGIRLAGVVRTAAGQPVANACVMAFPPDPSIWATTIRLGLACANSRGVYRGISVGFSGFPAGDYLLTAIPASQVTRWPDPALLASAARVATRVTVGWDEEKTQDLVLQENLK